MRAVYQAIVISIALLSIQNHTLATEQTMNQNGKVIQYDFGHQYQIHSEILSEDRQLLIYLPEAYKKSVDNFPVVYILEGATHYQHAILAIEKMQTSGWMPASIIVAITDNKGTNTRDYRLESDNFLQFINQEVQKFVTKNFRVNDYKTIFGHQYSGTFVLEAFIKNPEEFDNYIAANPYIRDDTIARFDNLLSNNKNLNQALYFSMGTVLDNGIYNVKPAEELAELLKKKAPKSLQWKYKYLLQHGVHGSANVSLYDAIAVNYADYLGSDIHNYQDFVDGNGMEGVEAAFQNRAKKYHISAEVDIGTFMGLGFMFMDGGHPKEAVELISDAIKNRFPESIQLHRVLGRAYLKMSSYQQAFNAYKKMVMLAKQQNHPKLDSFENLLKQVEMKL